MLAFAHCSTSYTLNTRPLHTSGMHLQPQMSGTTDHKLPIAAAAALAAASISSAAHASEPWAYSTLLTSIESDTVANVVFSPSGEAAVAVDDKGADHAVQLFPGADIDLVHSLRDKNVPFAVQPTPTRGPLQSAGIAIAQLALNIAPTLIFLAGLNFVARQGGGGGLPGGGPGAIGKSKSKIELEPETGVTFVDVAGCDGSKQELMEIVEARRTTPPPRACLCPRAWTPGAANPG